ncbi:hypothetical protein CI41S_30370 [Bradyrhizobium ivorense]|nr:hypothetical protein CI41S_30370 [Bradyrhizobium ivorense]
MRGDDNRTGELFSYVDLEARVRRDHPLRAIRTIVNEALAVLERELAALYSPIGRPSIPPEKLLRAMLLQAFYSIRSERLLMERLDMICCSAGSSEYWRVQIGPALKISPQVERGTYLNPD